MMHGQKNIKLSTCKVQPSMSQFSWCSHVPDNFLQICYRELHEDLINSLESHTRIQMDGRPVTALHKVCFIFFLLYKEVIH